MLEENIDKKICIYPYKGANIFSKGLHKVYIIIYTNTQKHLTIYII